ncbi:MAG: Threonine synthase [Anaerolinea thermophila]|uniref:Threonine synthase n=1 Tax=Anaerolinea thermophila TaxID=167964 RepID=A0A101FXQ2_9CHLR|nr:MAG: Threonine synthase [Anaerolinea thermophila]
MDVLLDYAELKKNPLQQQMTTSRDFSIWRYVPILPVEDPGFAKTPLHSVGWTPVYESVPLNEETGLNQLWIKDDGRNPTASFKDRASSVVVARAGEIHADVVVTASTGNAGAALAGMAAACGQKAVIFAPKTAPQAKIAQLLVFGAQVILVDGNYDQAFDLSVKASQEFGWYCRNTGYNPFTAEGKKTAAFEIWEQILLPNSNLKRELSVFVSVGDGNIISGIHKGFKDLKELGLIDYIPRIFGIQSEGSSAIANAYDAGTEEIEPVHATTLADSISVDLPRDGLRALRAATQTGGAYVKVSDDQIIQAIAALGKVGIFAEPAGATAYAGVLQASVSGLIKPEDPVVCMITGSGLKDINAAMKAVPSAPVIEPSMRALKNILDI